MTVEDKIILWRLIKKYAEVEVDYSWRGSKEPETIKLIDVARIEARQKLKQYIDRLE